MSRKAEFLAKATEVAALADSCFDWTNREALRCAAKSWRMLADLEGRDWLPTRWPVHPREANAAMAATWESATPSN